MAPLEHSVITTFLVTMLSFVLVMAMFFVLLVVRRRYLKAVAAEPEGLERETSVPAIRPVRRSYAWKRPSSWLAIKNRNLQAVQSALALHNPKPCSWVEGLSGDAERKLFISPPVSGWILVMGSALPDVTDDVDAAFRFLLELSRKLGHVQFFSANCMLNHHAWVQMDAGHVARAYAWAGETLWNQGHVTPAEEDLRMQCYDYLETAEPGSFDQPDPGPTNADKVHLLAARWSLDPDEIDERLVDQAWGILGDPARQF